MNENESVTLDVFVRSLAPARGTERQEAIIDQLDRLDADGKVSSYDVHVWGDTVPVDTKLSDSETGRAIRNRVAAFQQWTLAENVSVMSVFERTTTTSGMTGEEHTVISLPEITVAEYEGTELVGMAPHTDSEGTVGVRDYLDEIEQRRGRTLSDEAEAASRLAVGD